MKKKYFIPLILLIIVAGAGTYLIIIKKETTIAEKPENKKQETIIDSILSNKYDALEEVLKMNSDTSLVLMSDFMDGLVIKGQLENYLTKTDWGYIIKLKSPTPVTSPSLSGDTIYVSGGFGSKSYYSFHLQSGQLIWALDLNDDGPGPAIFQDSIMVFNTESCTIFALNRFSGEMLWSHWLGDPLLSFPIISDNKVYTSYPSLNIYSGVENTAKNKTKMKPSHPIVCMDSKTGTVLWQKWLDGDILVSPVADDKYVYATTFAGTVYKLDKNNGTIKACISIKATSPPSISGNKIFITKRSDDSIRVEESIALLDLGTLGFIKEFNTTAAPYLDYNIQKKSVLKKEADKWDIGNNFTDGAPLSSGWQSASKNIGQSSVSSLQLFQPSTVQFYGNNIVCLMGNKIFCIEPYSERIIWSYEITGDLIRMGGTAASTPIICSNYLVTVTVGGNVIVLNLDNGASVFEKNLNKKVRTSPVVKDGYIIVPTATGEMNVINTGIKGIDGWGMFMKNAQHRI